MECAIENCTVYKALDGPTFCKMAGLHTDFWVHAAPSAAAHVFTMIMRVFCRARPDILKGLPIVRPFAAFPTARMGEYSRCDVGLNTLHVSIFNSMVLRDMKLFFIDLKVQEKG
jgi:hypothetical protein